MKIPEQGQEGIWQKLGKLDWLGFVVLLPSIITLLLVMQWGGTRYAWSSAQVISLIVLSVLLTLAFITIQWFKKEDALIPLRILRQRSVAAGAAYCFALVASRDN